MICHPNTAPSHNREEEEGRLISLAIEYDEDTCHQMDLEDQAVEHLEAELAAQGFFIEEDIDEEVDRQKRADSSVNDDFDEDPDGHITDFEDQEDEDEEEENDDGELKKMDIDEEPVFPPVKPIYNFDPKRNYLADGMPKGGAWKRPEAPKINPHAEDFVFQHVDTTQDICRLTHRPIIRHYGVTKEGHSVVVSTASFRPYFFAHIPADLDPEDIRRKLEARLRRLCDYSKSYGLPGDKDYIKTVEPVHLRNMCGWHRHAPLDLMYKFTMAYPAHVKKARDALEYADRAVTNTRIRTFEANVPFELRYLVDKKLSGCQWMRLKAGTYTSTSPNSSNPYDKYNIQYRLDLNPGQDPEPIGVNEMGDIAPIRILSFDLEAKRLKPAGFVQADEDPVICICVCLFDVGKGLKHEAVFFYAPPGRDVEDIPGGATRFVFHSEEEMFCAFRQYIVEADPDMFSGWNITGFDWPYLAKRAAALSIDQDFMKFSRIAAKRARVTERMFQSRAYGAKKSSELVCEGRMDFDGLIFMLRGQMRKFRSYKLNAISKDVLKDEKVDVGYSEIPRLHEGTDAERARLAWYCLKDAKLPVELLEKLMAIVNGVEQARVTGVPIKWLLTRGQGIKTFSNILRYKDDCETVPSRTPKQNAEFTAGGYVRKPIVGYYRWPLATLDFSSLYPSIMQAFNICYSTVESLAWAKKNMPDGSYWVPPGIENCDFCFVKKEIREGVLPKMLTSLLGQRRYVKGLMKQVDEETQALLYKVLDGRQLALKVVCNSVYGFLKAFILTDARLMAAVTAWGQDMIKECASLVESHFRENSIIDREACERLGLDYERADPTGLPRKIYGARIIYGDTDSIMVDFGDTSLQEIARLGHEAAKLCTSRMQEPNSLVFESVKLVSVFMAKKRYASLEIEGVRPGETIPQAMERAAIVPKGLESKRRDNAKIGSETQWKCLELLLKKRDMDAAAQHVKQVISDILMDRVDMSKYVITKGLSKTDEQYRLGGSKQQHTELKKRIAARAHRTGEVVPDTGDRVPFIIRAAGKGEKACDLSEDPIYAQKNAVPINTTYYIYKQVMAATLKLFTALWQKEMLPTIKSSMSLKKLRQLHAYNRLFRPDLPHMKSKKLRKTRNYGIGLYARPLPQCLEPTCRVILPRGLNVVCREHASQRDELHQAYLEKDRALAARKDAAWTRCKECAGGGFDVVSCSNMTCDNFFHRQQTIMDLEDLGKDLVKFNLMDCPSPPRAKPQGRNEPEAEKREREEQEEGWKMKSQDIRGFFQPKRKKIIL